MGLTMTVCGITDPRTASGGTVDTGFPNAKGPGSNAKDDREVRVGASTGSEGVSSDVIILRGVSNWLYGE